MRHTLSLCRRARSASSLRLFRASGPAVLCQLCVLLTPPGAFGQSPIESAPETLLTGDPREFVEWVETHRPTPVSGPQRVRILASLPREGEITRPAKTLRAKLKSLAAMLRASGRDSVYEIKVAASALARTGVYERTVIVITEAALRVANETELQALVAHDLAHEYMWVEHQRAAEMREHRRLKEHELLCDAIAIVILNKLGVDPVWLISAVEKLTKYNETVFGAMVDESDYPSASERRKFATAVIAWLKSRRPE